MNNAEKKDMIERMDGAANDRSADLQYSRIDHSVKGTAFGVITVAFTTIIPFFIRTLLIRFLGENYLGLHSLIASIMSLLSISDLGVSQVIIFFLYEPAAKSDHRKVNELLNEIRLFYRKVAAFFLFGGLLIAPFLSKIISQDISFKEVYPAFFCYLAACIFQNLLWPETASLLMAFQRVDLDNLEYLLACSIAYILQIVAICVFHSYFFYVICIFLQVVLVALFRKWLQNKYFPEYMPYGRTDEKERKKISMNVVAMMGHQMDEKFLGSIDNVVLTAYLGLEVVAIYGNYYYVVAAVTLLLNAVYHGVLSSLGNAIVVETKESNYNRFRCIFFLSGMLAGWSTACLLCMYQTFMYLWMADHILPVAIVFLMSLYSYLIQMRKTVQTFKNAAGMWRNDAVKPYVSIIADLVLDLLLIKWIGMEGAIIASIFCVLFIEIPWEVVVLFRDYFGLSIKQYVKMFAHYTVVNLILCALCYGISHKFIPNYGILAFIAEFLVCSFTSIFLFTFFYRKTAEARMWIESLKIAWSN